MNDLVANAPPIEQSVELDLNYPPVCDRYFSHFYLIPKNPFKKSMVKPKRNECKDESKSANERREDDFTPKGEDTCVLVHSNKICVVTLSPKHPVVVQKKTIIKIEFNVNGVDRLANKVSGKGKRGAQIVGMFSPLVKLQCGDGSSYTVYFGVRGKLIEINERLITKPNLIVDHPQAEGYLAIVLPKLDKKFSLEDFLVDQQEYDSIYQHL